MANINPTFYWIRQEAQRRFNSAEASFMNALATWRRLAESGAHGCDIRQAGQRAVFEAQALLSAERKLTEAGLSGNAHAIAQAREVVFPGAGIQRNRNRGDWSK
ncbi:MAG: hypothetical protein Q4F30_06375 [Akkermansia sp.]|nr:hypothetical protein [Akkermansia sp.]